MIFKRHWQAESSKRPPPNHHWFDCGRFGLTKIVRPSLAVTEYHRYPVLCDVLGAVNEVRDHSFRAIPAAETPGSNLCEPRRGFVPGPGKPRYENYH